MIPVGTAVIIVAGVKSARVLTSTPTMNAWCAHNTNPSNRVANMAKIVLNFRIIFIFVTVQI